MKLSNKLLFILTLLTAFSGKCIGQNDYAVLHFINTDQSIITLSENPTIQINNLLIGTSDSYSQIKYKMYSEGEISIISRSNICTTIQLKIDVKKGNEYYFRVQFRTSGFSGQKSCLEEISAEDATALLAKKRIDSTIELTEDINNPIGILHRKQDKKGTGFLINEQGYIITNYHVVEDAKTIKIKGIKGDFATTIEAKLIAVDLSTDLALLQVSSNLFTFDPPPYYYENVTSQKGEDVYALGYPLTESMGEEIKITKGVLSSLTGFKGDISNIQLSAQIQPGNSGGPVFNDLGQLIGIVTAKHASASDAGYAIKMSYVTNFLNNLDNLSFSQGSVNKDNQILKDLNAYSKWIYIVESYVE